MAQTEAEQYGGGLQFGDGVKILSDDYVDHQPDGGGSPVRINRKKIEMELPVPDGMMEWENKRWNRFKRRTRTWLSSHGLAKPPGELSDKINIYAEIHSKDGGSDKVVVPVHGLTSINKTWDETLRNELAAAGYTVIVPDLPNHGKSGAMCWKGIKVNDYSEMVYRQLKGLGIRDWALASSSGSAPFVMAMAVDHPESVVGVFGSAPVCNINEIPGVEYVGYYVAKALLCTIDSFSKDSCNIIEKVKNFQAHHRSQTEAEKELYLHSAKYDANRNKNPRYKITNKVLIRTMTGWKKYKPRIPAEVPFATQFSEKDTISKVKRTTLIKNSIKGYLARHGLGKPPKRKDVLDLLEEKRSKYTDIHEGKPPTVYVVMGEVGHHIQKEAPVPFADNLRHFLDKIGYLPEGSSGETKKVYVPKKYSDIYMRDA